ncbi:hypothetical protein DSCA_05150 [Desulfosarcina alkanivorans]|uniref:Uncharacterized protein n=1 Tax=Desulfosarcina alkanivorans TaxID=571177 RepID=A0A5K7YDR6_9BACT|nr:hypothetical protein [Desulfosarcina alkanivorans]BBO66585.1 hypothetical protein DSCA_05150 [Desulfosarcina alkanivorans]
MNDYFARFSESPASFKKSFYMLVVAWICHPVFIYSIFWARDAVAGSDKDIMKMAIVSICLCFLLFLIKKWARALVVVGNAFILINDFFYFFITSQHTISTILCVTVVLFTIMGTYWLFVKDSRDYFTRVNPKQEPPETPGTGTGPSHRRPSK